MLLLPFDVKSVQGNAPENVKDFVETLLRRFTTTVVNRRMGFADSVGLRLKVTEVGIKPKENAPTKKEATVVCELDVKEDMLNGAGHMHGGCAAYLIDMCTSLPLAVLLEDSPGVSQAINMTYHAPAPLGTHLRIIGTTVALGGRTMTARGEIWDTNNNRLVASGVHNKMMASRPKL